MAPGTLHGIDGHCESFLAHALNFRLDRGVNAADEGFIVQVVGFDTLLLGMPQGGHIGPDGEGRQGVVELPSERGRDQLLLFPRSPLLDIAALEQRLDVRIPRGRGADPAGLVFQISGLGGVLLGLGGIEAVVVLNV